MIQIWSVYDHPKDEPLVWLARRWDIDSNGARPTMYTVTATTLEGLRELLSGMGLVGPFQRSEKDDPVIVESWL
jgi:hypothetical protein